MVRVLLWFGVTLLFGCSSSPVSAPRTLPARDAGVSPQVASLSASLNSTRFVAREHFLAGAEMQISGEPLAEAMGRDLSAYSRDHVPPDIYFDSSSQTTGPFLDPTGFSSAVESYEYSKLAMNAVAFESGAGTSLAYAPLLNPKGVRGDHAVVLLAARLAKFAASSHAAGRYVFAPGSFPANNPRAGDTNPQGKGEGAHNPLGWPGIWPTTHVFTSFDPKVDPTSEVVLGCTISSDDDPGASGALGSSDYECDATSLHLPERTKQVEASLSPGADGFAAFKYGLWVLNYLQSMHAADETAVASVADDDLARVGTADNQIQGSDAQGQPTTAGTYLGSSDIEGFQAALFIEEVDNSAEDWLMHLTTGDGKTLSGFKDVHSALRYDYDSPLRWFPSRISVEESDEAGFPKPAYTLGSADSQLLDLLGMCLGYAEFYSLTDTENAAVGGSQGARSYFDADPFPAPGAGSTGSLHERALAMLRVTLINLDRMHVDPDSGVLVESVHMKGAEIERGTQVSTPTLAYAVLSLRAALRALSSQLRLYSNNTPDTIAVITPVEMRSIHVPQGSDSFAARLRELLRAQGEVLFDHLTDASGRAFGAWDVSTGAVADDSDKLDAHTAAVRGLFALYLATGDVRYRERAVAVWRRLDAVFYDADARLYTDVPAPADSVEYTPLRFALLQSSLRDVYELVATRPGGEALEPLLQDRIGRLNKLVLNGWDDRNQNRVVDWPDECVRVQDGLPRGGLQMAERTLTGETGSKEDQLKPGQKRTPTSDRESDCVPEIDDAHMTAALADSITFNISRP